MSVPILGQQQPAATEPQIRLLICLQCKTIEELPDYEGDPHYDYLLENLCERHESAGVRHAGHLVKVPLKAWESTATRKEIIRQIRQGTGGMSELDATFYDTRSTFAADALQCYAKHLRPKGRCPDWRHDSKKLTPKTAAERKDAGLPAPKKLAGLPMLCDFCPAKTFMLTKAREERGMYE